jgi:predicted nucleic acid-binding Zn ribbon protein
MAFFDDVQDKLSQASQSAVHKAKGLSEVAKLNGAISETENQIRGLYGQLGYDVYCAYQNDPLPEFSETIGHIKELHAAIGDYQAQIKAINEADTCPGCGAKVREGMAFCSECGCKLPAQESQADTEQTAFCTQCGAALLPGGAFCTSCGKKVE